MPKFKSPPTAIARKLKELRKAKAWSQTTFAEKSGISIDTIKSVESGRTRNPDTHTVARICAAFGVEPTYLISDHSYSNYHLVRGNDAKLSELEARFGPAGRQGLQLGNFATTWLQFDTCAGQRYAPDLISGRVLNEPIDIPRPFAALRETLLRENDLRKQRGQKSFFNGPSLCLSRFLLSNSEDSREDSVLRLFFKPSIYANNKTAKDVSGSPLRYEALQNWRFLDQPIEHISSGVGNALVLFCDSGKRAIFTKRSNLEEFRSGDYDVAVVEGIHPVKDARPDGNIDLYGAARRGVAEECGVDLPETSIRLIGFGNDLEYYQWCILGYATTDLTYTEVVKHWHGAADRKETEDMFATDADPVSVLSFCRDRAIWGCGLASAYFSLCKIYGQTETIAAANRVFSS